ncbi:zinc finger MYM-type protein 1-like [Trifolium pratense]|uniref:zinc finger MYM-type protein 1-like n=1 Tax=Trifolium pratense TaxID=57577 RepID=UPI001E69151D|nr:zinc finger MYM-type protein 1-like [Trifolium pratense]
MVREKIIDSFFKRKNRDNEEVESLRHTSATNSHINVESVDKDEQRIEPSSVQLAQPPPCKAPRIEQERINIDIDTLIRDPGKRPLIWNYCVNQQDEIRRAYIKLGPYQILMDMYPLSGQEDRPRRFQAHWYKAFHWLEYSPEEDAVFCFPCYLFSKKLSPFTTKGFRNWKKVNNGKDCAFLNHMGKSPNSSHNVALRCYEDFKNHSCHIENVLSKLTEQQILSNRLRLKTTIDAVRWLTFQACPFRGHDESLTSRNRGNFLEMIKILADYNKDVKEVQKEIREEIGNSKFCLLVDEARDESKKEQMAVVIRFVDKSGYVKERFLDIVHVDDTTSSTLKQGICSILSRHNLDIQNVRGQGYDGASNMRGGLNDLQALILQECPYAYYVHCLAHQLQLVLVASSKEVAEVHTFFQTLNKIVNVVCSSCKRNDELQTAYENEIIHLVENNEIETGRGANQTGTLQRPAYTRWSSHFNSICSLLRMYNATILVLEDYAVKGSSSAQRGDAKYCFKAVMSFEFAFILHVMKEIMGITDKLCQALQKKSQDILNAMCLVSSTKALIQKLRDLGWDSVLENVKAFCNIRAISIPDMSGSFADLIRSRRQEDAVTVEHHYRVDLFNAIIDFQLNELNSRFSEQATELITLSTSLNPKNAFKSFNARDICSLVEKFYPSDFSIQERIQLEYELQHYEFEVLKDVNFQNLSTIGDFCQKLVETSKSNSYPLIDRVLRLVLTLPVSTATTERAFSAMKIIKTRLRSKMGDDFLKSYMIVYIEDEIAEKFTSDMIVDEFDNVKPRRLDHKK